MELMINEFVHLAVDSIRRGIEKANKTESRYKAVMTDTIEFDLAVLDGRVVDSRDADSNNIQRFKFTIKTVDYPQGTNNGI